MIAITPNRSIEYGVNLQIYKANTGEGLLKHDHTFDHLTMCFAGSCVVRKAGKEIVINKDSTPLNLVANEWHEIEALEDGTIFVNIFKV